MTGFKTRLITALAAALLLVSLCAAALAELAVPNPEAVNQLGEITRAGGRLLSDENEGFVAYCWQHALPDDVPAEAIKAWTDAFSGWYTAQCARGGYAPDGQETDENGLGFYYYAAGGAMFALYLSRFNVQLVVPVGARLDEVTADAAVDIAFPAADSVASDIALPERNAGIAGLADTLMPDPTAKPAPTPLPTVPPKTNMYVRGTLNGEPVEYTLTRLYIKGGKSQIMFTDDMGKYPLKGLWITYDKPFVLYERYHVDRSVRPSGLTIRTYAQNYEVSKSDTYNTDFPMPSGDYLDLCLTEIAPGRMAGTLSFSVGGGRYVFENGEFLGFAE